MSEGKKQKVVMKLVSTGEVLAETSINVISEPKLFKNKSKVIAVFYHGGPHGKGQIRETSKNAGDTGEIYDKVSEFVVSQNREFLGAIIAPAAIQYFGVSTGNNTNPYLFLALLSVKALFLLRFDNIF